MVPHGLGGVFYGARGRCCPGGPGQCVCGCGRGTWGGRLLLRGGWALRGVQFLFFRSFLLVLKKISFWGEDWALVYNSMKLEIFLLFPNFLGPKFSVTPQLGYTTFIINNQASLHLW